MTSSELASKCANKDAAVLLGTVLSLMPQLGNRQQQSPPVIVAQNWCRLETLQLVTLSDFRTESIVLQHCKAKTDNKLRHNFIGGAKSTCRRGSRLVPACCMACRAEGPAAAALVAARASMCCTTSAFLPLLVQACIPSICRLSTCRLTSTRGSAYVEVHKYEGLSICRLTNTRVASKRTDDCDEGCTCAALPQPCCQHYLRPASQIYAQAL